MGHLFISYSKQNIDFARYFRRLLEDKGFLVWMDEAGLTPSDRWWRTIEQQIETCSAFIVIMSPEALESDWVEREILLAEKLKRPLYPVLLAGEPWSRLANIQYEIMTSGLRAQLSSRVIDALRRACGQPADGSRGVEIALTEGDITTLAADVLAFKHARQFYGADAVVASMLMNEGYVDVEAMTLSPGEYRFIETQGVLAAPLALFLGTPGPRQFTYAEVQKLARDTVRILADALPDAKHLAMTIHGVGFGLDESEAFRAQITGYAEALSDLQGKLSLERISIVEQSSGRIARLQALAAESAWQEGIQPSELGLRIVPATGAIEPVSPATERPKPYAFVAMPVRSGLEDLYEYGVMGAVHACGLLCARPEDISSSEGIEQAIQKINDATVVIADVSSADVGVMLNVGYAWGVKRATILIAHREACPPFAESSALLYDRIKDLESNLRSRLETLIFA